MVADDPVRHRQFALSQGAQRLLYRFADWTEFPGAERAGGGQESQLIRQLLGAHILVAEDSPEHRLEKDLGPWAQWGTAATYYHLATRNHRDEKFASAAEDTVWLLDHHLLRWVAGPLHQVPIPGFRHAMLKASPSPGALHALEMVLDRVAWKYRTGGTYRSLFMELGHFSQMAYLVGTGLGLGMCFTAATRDEAIEDALGLDWTREILLGVNGVGVAAPDEAARQEAMLTGGEAGFSFAGDVWDGRGA